MAEIPELKLSDRSDGRATQRAILEATLNLILEQGIRSIKYKTVAEKSGVSHSAIAYYFNDIDSLINHAFLYYLDIYGRSMKESRDIGFNLLASFRHKNLQEPQVRRAFMDAYLDKLMDIVASLSDRGYEYMKLDQIFRNEMDRNSYFRDEMMMLDKKDIDAIALMLKRLGTRNPEMEAFQLMSVLWLASVSMLHCGYRDDYRQMMRARIRYTLLGILELPQDI